MWEMNRTAEDRCASAFKLLLKIHYADLAPVQPPRQPAGDLPERRETRHQT